jgi:integrase
MPRKRVLTSPELLSVWRAADRAGYPFGTIVKLLILTGQRWCEIVSLCTDYIDKKDQTITLPETKNGRNPQPRHFIVCGAFYRGRRTQEHPRLLAAVPLLQVPRKIHVDEVRGSASGD